MRRVIESLTRSFVVTVGSIVASCVMRELLDVGWYGVI